MARFGRGFPLHAIRTTRPAPALLSRSVSDSALAADSVGAPAFNLQRAVTESALAADTVARSALNLQRSLSDSALALDAASHAIPRTVTESALAVDSVARSALHLSRVVSDSALASETTVRGSARSIVDSASASDTVARSALNLQRSISDSALASDALVRSGLDQRGIADSALASDTVARSGLNLQRGIADSAFAADFVVRGGARSLADSALASDTVVRSGLLLHRYAFESALASETAGTGFQHAVVANPNWPLVGVDCDFNTSAGPPAAPPAITRVSLDAPYHQLTARKIHFQRGRQYELDQVQAGQCTIEIPDEFEQLNADNASSPFNTGGNSIDSYRPMWVWAMWPNQPGNGNIYNQNVVSSADPSFESSTGTGPIDAGFGTGTTAVLSTDFAYLGTKSLKVVQGGSGSSFGVYGQRCNVTAPGVTYVISAYVYCVGGSSVTISVTDAAGGLHTGSTAGAQNAWTRISVPWTTVDTLEKVTFSATGTGSPTFYLDAMQLEFGATALTFTTAGPKLYPQFTGYVERFPTEYDMNGYRAIRPLVAVDALAMLSRTAIFQSYDQTIKGDNPQFELKFDDPAGPPKITGNPPGFAITSDVQGGSIGYAGDTAPDGQPAITISQQIQGQDAVVNTTLTDPVPAGSLAIKTKDQIKVGDYVVVGSGSRSDWAQVWYSVGPGQEGSTANPITYYIAQVTKAPPQGYIGLNLSHRAGDTVTSYANQDTYISTSRHSTYSAQWGYNGCTFEGWFKPTVGDITMLMADSNVSGAQPTGSNVSTPNSYRDSFVGIQSFYYGMQFVLGDVNNGPSNTRITAILDPAGKAIYSAYPDGNWHYYAIRIYANPANPAQYLWEAHIDGNPAYLGPVTGTQAVRRVSMNQLTQIVSTYTGSPQSTVSCSKVAFYPMALGRDRLMAHYLRGIGNRGEKTGARVLQLLNQYWGGAIFVDPGYLSMADDLTYDPTVITEFSSSGAGQNRTMLDVLQEIQDSERGLCYASSAGVVVFEDRATRYRYQTALATLGEDPNNDHSEYPYTTYEADFDPTYTFTQADLTSPDNQNFLPLVNQAAQNRYGQRVLTQQIQGLYDYDLEQAALFYLTRYGKPRTRLTKLTLNPAANPALWPIALGLEISQRFTVTRRSRSGTVVTRDYYVEEIQGQIDAENGSWTYELQLSPVFVPQAWILGDATLGVLGSTTNPIY